MLNPLVHWEPGTLVRYHGSLSELHGIYQAFPCDCLPCGDDRSNVRFRLEAPDTTVMCVRPRSVTGLDDDTDRGDHDGCIEPHPTVDGYVDCDGTPL
ncbi:hypothetical protein ACWGH4_26235 [Streptomyces sp. NPDC054847]